MTGCAPSSSSILLRATTFTGCSNPEIGKLNFGKTIGKTGTYDKVTAVKELERL
jgi:hypothetical protein